MGVSRRTKQKEMKKNLIAFGIIAVFAVVVFSVNSVGKFIAQKVIDPIMNIGSEKEEKVSTETISCEKLETFLVSAGVFNEKSETETVAKSVFASGGGGYCLKTDSGTHVIYSCYKDKASAEAKAQELKTSFDKTTVVTLKIDKISLKITGTGEQTEAIRKTFEFLSSATGKLSEISAKVASDELAPLKACQELQQLMSGHAECEEALSVLESSNATVVSLKDMMALCSTLFAELPQSSDVDFNQKINYVSCAFACEYIKFCSDLE